MDEVKLLSSLKNDDPDAPELLFKYCQPPLLDYTVHLTHNRMDAEDIVANVFARFYDKKLHNHIDSKLLSYMMAMCKNECRRFYQRTKNREIRHQKYYDNPTVPTNYWQDNQNRADEENRREQINLLNNAINTLPEKRKQTITMRYILEMSNKEIAQLSNMKVDTVKKLTYLGLETLRNIFGKNKHD